MTSLADFRDEFAHALLAQDDAHISSAWRVQPAFAVYRNTVLKGCIDALEANYPSVARLVGQDWFRSAAACFAQVELPQDGLLLGYGAGFPAFLARFEPAAALPYLADVARLDRFWTEAHMAADAPALSGAELAGLPPERLTGCRLAPHPAARWAWFEGMPIHAIWQRNRQPEGGQPQHDLAWHSEGSLLARPGDAVAWWPVGAADCVFLDACAQGSTLSVAIEHASQADPQADLSAMLARLLQAGALTATWVDSTGDLS